MKAGSLFLTICLLHSFFQYPFAQAKTDKFLENLLYNNASPALKTILQKPDSFRYQLIYTKIDRNRKNQPHFTSYCYHVNKDEYFNPASTVKMPLAFLALEKLNYLARHGIDKNTPMFTDSAFAGQTKVWADSSAPGGLPSIAHYIRKIFLVSDNDAYNRLYEFVGQQTINESLWQKGYPGVRITRRFVPMNEDQNRHTNPMRFVAGKKILYEQPPVYSKVTFDFRKKVLIGNAHYNTREELVQQPMDFTTHNNVALEDLHMMLRSVLFPEAFPLTKRFNLTSGDYNFLYRCMSEYPSESKFPSYDTSEYFDAYTKFFLFKSGRSNIPSHIRIFNKPGWSYGFLTDVAYIVDFKNKIEFFLTGTIYVNSDGVLNDDRYEYDQTGYPFFKEAGNIIYNYEQSRHKKYAPDLKRFRLTYGTNP